jgi:hypothetical protein
MYLIVLGIIAGVKSRLAFSSHLDFPSTSCYNRSALAAFTGEENRMSTRKTTAAILAAAMVLLLAACATSTPAPQVLADCFVSFQLAAWLDLDGDGQWGASEPSLEGVEFRLQGTFPQIWGQPFVSDEDGRLSISTWSPGECIEHDSTITAVPPESHEPTTPASVTFSITSAAGAFEAQFGFRATP